MTGRGSLGNKLVKLLISVDSFDVVYRQLSKFFTSVTEVLRCCIVELQELHRLRIDQSHTQRNRVEQGVEPCLPLSRKRLSLLHVLDIGDVLNHYQGQVLITIRHWACGNEDLQVISFLFVSNLELHYLTADRLPFQTLRH